MNIYIYIHTWIQEVKKTPDGELQEIINEIENLVGSFPIEIDHDTFSVFSSQQSFKRDLDLLRNDMMIFCSSMKKITIKN